MAKVEPGMGDCFSSLLSSCLTLETLIFSSLAIILRKLRLLTDRSSFFRPMSLVRRCSGVSWLLLLTDESGWGDDS